MIKNSFKLFENKQMINYYFKTFMHCSNKYVNVFKKVYNLNV